MPIQDETQNSGLMLDRIFKLQSHVNDTLVDRRELSDDIKRKLCDSLKIQRVKNFRILITSHYMLV